MNDGQARQVAQELQLLRSRQMQVLFHGHSMLPLLQDGDRVIVEVVEWRSLRPGDLVTYRFADKFPTRRIVRKRRHGLLLWCDNWPHQRFEASREDVLGRAIARERASRWLTCDDPEWRGAARRGLARFRYLAARRVLGRLKRTVARVLRPIRTDARGGA